MRVPRLVVFHQMFMRLMSHMLVTRPKQVATHKKPKYDSSIALPAKLLQYVKHETASQDNRFTSRRAGFAVRILCVQDSIASFKSAAIQYEPTGKLFSVNTNCLPMPLSYAATLALAAAISS